MADNKTITSRKAQMLERLKAKKPDLNIEDEEAVFGAINDDYDESDEYRTSNEASNKRVLDILERDGRAGQFFVEMINGKDPLIAMIEEYGPDFRVALEDPEKAEEIAEANKKYREKILKSKELETEAEANLQASLDALDAAQSESGVSDEVITKVTELYAQIVRDAIVDKVDKATWDMLIKAVNYDADVADAEHMGEVRGKNTRIDEFKRKVTQSDAMPPALGGQPVAQAPQRDPMDEGFLARAKQPSIYERGGMKRKKTNNK